LKKLDGRTAIVTGAAMGIGRATAVLLAKEGANVVVADINEEEAGKTVELIEEAGGVAKYVVTDVSKDEDIKNMIEFAVKSFGTIDVLHNNAGIALGANVVETTDDIWNKVITVNLTSVYRACKYAIPYMIKNGGGSIINTTSVQALRCFEGWAAYAASKGGIYSLTQQIAGEYAKNQVRVNSVAPGTIETPMNTKVFSEVDDPEALKETWNQMHPIGRFGQPEEIAEAVLFLASDSSSFITGQCIVADGGATIKAE
jgi:NAD(P)-dependent dehydrogenase (short-subunit alcohol dehydrogenase family)